MKPKFDFWSFWEPGGYPQTSRAPPEVEGMIFHRFFGVLSPVFETLWPHLGSPLATVVLLWGSAGRPGAPEAASGALPGGTAICTATVAGPRLA